MSQSNTRDYTVVEEASLDDLVLRILGEAGIEFGDLVERNVAEALAGRTVLVQHGTFNCLHARQALRQATKAVYGRTGADTKMAAPTSKALEMVPVRTSPDDAPVSVG